MFESLPDVLTVKQLQSVIPINRNKLYALLSSGELPSFRLGRNIYIPKESLVLFIKGRMGQKEGEQYEGNKS